MKKYKYIAVCLMASVLLTTGCADSFLEVSSPTDETIDTTSPLTNTFKKP